MQSLFPRDLKPKMCHVLSPQVNDPALRGSSLFTTNQLPGMDMIKQEGDASRVSSGSPECAVGGWKVVKAGGPACLGLGNAGVRNSRYGGRCMMALERRDGRVTLKVSYTESLRPARAARYPVLEAQQKRPPP